MRTGTVTDWNDCKGYGHIQLGQKSVFVHYTAIYMDGFKSLSVGQKVRVELIDGPEGPQASRVELVE